MATKRRKSRRRTLKMVRDTSKRDRALSIAGQIGVRILSDPEAMRGIGLLLEVAGRALQRTAVVERPTPTPLLPADVLDLSAFREKKKDPSDG